VLHALEVALEICLGYVACSLLCTGVLFALVSMRGRALAAKRPPREAADDILSRAHDMQASWAASTSRSRAAPRGEAERLVCHPGPPLCTDIHLSSQPTDI
jgi:hypothetical protein